MKRRVRVRFFGALSVTSAEVLKIKSDGEMRSLGLDVGDKRTGVAISDPRGILATPLTVLASEDQDGLINGIIKLAEEYKAERVVLGLPRRLGGDLGKQANKVTAFAEKLSAQAKQSNLDQLDVQLWDERLSTKAAERLKADSDRTRKVRHGAKRRMRSHGFSVTAGLDAIAAAYILQGFLDSRRVGNSEES